MIYDLSFDYDLLEEPPGGSKHPIHATESNIDIIKYKGVKIGYVRYLILDGKELTDLPEIKFYYSSKMSSLKNEYLLNDYRWPIIHKKVMEEFQNQQVSNVQYIPITLSDIDTDEEIHEYYAMNILNSIEAIDLEKSEYDYDEEFNVYWFLPHSIYLNPSICEGHDIFRASKSSTYVYVSQKIKDIIEANNWIGFSFRKEQLSENKSSVAFNWNS